ncbi:ZPR1 zinc finger domain-containing protein [Infirmifilum lucidum]|uniref:ZPR1 zinc finger domain-containing protein n=1 Tax=Infirmifilum lucidum TaxID=2776706 RepID=A0A7L9FIU0_9CREN|nr:ZPR1 zinc finger domain-containing protein [Infirmifilum lucidum]QOJ79637.1 ZPR1 zinc finger domain-containing protein [Infirmifilum lucidum]
MSELEHVLENPSVYGKKLGEFTTQCPFCGGPLHVVEIEYEIPVIGKTLIVSKKCSKCGYKRNDVVPLAGKEHLRVYFKVEEPEDFDVKVVRSPTARVVIPELGLELDPGIDAEMFVTNIEGILQLFLDALHRLRVLEPEADISAIENTIRQILEKRRGGFTVVLDDENGLSTFYSETRNLLVLSERTG